MNGESADKHGSTQSSPE